MGKTSRDKGKRGERELAQLIREHGFDARRGVQYNGLTGEAPDVACAALATLGLHIECKRVEALALYPALAQAERDAPVGCRGVVFHRRNSQPWVVVLNAAVFLALLGRVSGTGAIGPQKALSVQNSGISDLIG